MSDSTPQIEQVDSSQAQHEITVNNLFDAASVATAYGRHAEACAGRTFAYYGVRFGGILIDNGEYLCDASDTTYMVVNRATGEVSFDTSTYDWNNDTNFARAYLIVVGASTITSYEDHRFGPGGVFGASDGGGGAAAWGSITGTLADQTDLQTALDAKAPIGIPQNSQSTAYTLVLGDANKHLLHPSADTTARIFTIPANSSVAFPVGTAVTFVNQNGAGTITIAITTDTMRLAGAGTTGSRTLAANGIATALKITSTQWIISGTGLT